jgi:hypothetical protein
MRLKTNPRFAPQWASRESTFQEYLEAIDRLAAHLEADGRDPGPAVVEKKRATKGLALVH